MKKQYGSTVNFKNFAFVSAFLLPLLLSQNSVAQSYRIHLGNNGVVNMEQSQFYASNENTSIRYQQNQHIQVHPQNAYNNGCISVRCMGQSEQIHISQPKVYNQNINQNQGSYSLQKPNPIPKTQIKNVETPKVKSTHMASLPQNKPKSEAQKANLPYKYHRQLVDYHGSQKAGTILVDTSDHLLYHILPGKKAMRYGIGVARDGFEWSGTHKVTRKAKWPSWTPPPEMRKREPHLPITMEGGLDNPLGARALYLGNTLYRIHGSNQPWSIGKDVSSGCIRMLNEDVIHLYNNVNVGTKVVVI